jgi:hypothetical protein
MPPQFSKGSSGGDPQKTTSHEDLEDLQELAGRGKTRKNTDPYWIAGTRSWPEAPLWWRNLRVRSVLFRVHRCPAFFVLRLCMPMSKWKVSLSRALLSGFDACKILGFEILLPEMHES